MVVGSCVIRSLKFPTRSDKVCYGTCDGLVCLFSNRHPSVVFNPATRWRRSFPLSRVQPLIISHFKTMPPLFDFTTNAWRYVLPASPYRILDGQKPVYFDGSLYWLTECKETKLLSFDLHTETFQVICNAPFSHVPDPRFVVLCILDNRLRISLKIYPTKTQVIWSLGGCNMMMTWKQMCSIDVTKTTFHDPPYLPRPALLPIAIVDETILLLGYRRGPPLVIHDLHTKSYVFDSFPKSPEYPVCYFPSLLPNTYLLVRCCKGETTHRNNNGITLAFASGSMGIGGIFQRDFSAPTGEEQVGPIDSAKSHASQPLWSQWKN
uniref:F-box associated beta-propeller type 1 domain-containing protein n=1 Tax=Brassica oleracea TaxID=3712 RepID=A0A3P6DZY0_BRAOL|nr:unnamed protein product [Brassica oleracea]